MSTSASPIRNSFPFDDNLEVKKYFLGYYELENIESVTAVNAIKDILLRFNLRLQQCSGQIYDRARNMMGKKSVVNTKLLVKQPKTLVTHCQGCSTAWLFKILLHVVKYYVTL